MLRRRRDVIISYWRELQIALGERFRREAQTLLGREEFKNENWETMLFARFVEAFEVTAVQRGAPRWDVDTGNRGVQRIVPPLTHTGTGPSCEESSQITDTAHASLCVDIIPFQQVGSGAYRTHLPYVGALAAGHPAHGLETGSLDDVEELDWITVPPHLAKEQRFVVQVNGDSMEPTLQIGDLLIFEYHRVPRKQREIVIANVLESDAVTVAIKRIREDLDHWIFESDNPSYAPIRVMKLDLAHPILGTMIDFVHSQALRSSD